MDTAALRQELVRSAVVAMTTIVLGFIVAGVTGIFSKLDGIAEIKKDQVLQSAQLADMKEKIDKRKDDVAEIRINIAGFTGDHRFLIDEVHQLRAELVAERKLR